MKKVLFVYNDNIQSKQIMELLTNCDALKNYVFEKLLIVDNETNGKIQGMIANCDADVIITVDMAGFQYKTLLENYLYNILSVRQMHLILEPKMWRTYRDSDFAVNSFVYVPQDTIIDIVKNNERPNIRYYSSTLLKIKTDMIDRIVNDFMEAVGFI